MVTQTGKTNNYNTHNAWSIILGSLKKYNVKKTFPQKSCKNWDWWIIPQLFLFFEKVKTNCIIFQNVGAEIFDFVDAKVLD